jgi:hypothetical protein
MYVPGLTGNILTDGNDLKVTGHLRTFWRGVNGENIKAKGTESEKCLGTQKCTAQVKETKKQPRTQN